MTKIIIKPGPSDLANTPPASTPLASPPVGTGRSPNPPSAAEEARAGYAAERLFRAAEANKLRSGAPGEVGTNDLSAIEWSVIPHYGYDHGKQTAQLAAHIAGTLPSIVQTDYQVIRALGLYHDLGRAEDWRQPDPDHGKRSAALAEVVLRKDPELWAKRELHAEICHLIAVHKLYDPVKHTPPSDPRLIALWDAECFEAARFAPRTTHGVSIMMERFAWVQSPWAKNVEHQRRWRAHRGW